MITNILSASPAPSFTSASSVPAPFDRLPLSMIDECQGISYNQRSVPTNHGIRKTFPAAGSSLSKSSGAVARNPFTAKVFSICKCCLMQRLLSFPRQPPKLSRPYFGCAYQAMPVCFHPAFFIFARTELLVV